MAEDVSDREEHRTMPYAMNADNHAFESHHSDPCLEEIAHRIAWSDVKRQ